MNINNQNSVKLSDKAVASISNRKRPLQVNNWKNTVAKRLKNSGQPYIGKSGTFVPGKAAPTVAKTCGARCSLVGCTINPQDKVNLFQSFYEVGEWNLQRTFLLNSMERSNNGSVRVRYFVTNCGERTEVCKMTWMDVFQITPGPVKTLKKKSAVGDVIAIDKRGQHINRHTNTTALKQLIRNHINSFPLYNNHYSRDRLGDYFLSPDLNVALMFRLFVDAHPLIPDVGKKETLYRELFKESKLKIGIPRSDTCATCDMLDVQMRTAPSQSQRVRAAEEKGFHLVDVESAMNCMKDDMLISQSDPSFVAICMDMQQVLFSPTLTHSKMFYSRQLSTYNYNIYDGATGDGFMTTWEETTAGPGADEVVSVLHRHLTQKYAPLPQGQSRTLVLWSDRCVGQTNNYILLAYLKYIVSLGLFTEVNQKFLYTGHSYLPCDRQFAQIEKKKKAAKVNTPDDWTEVIKSSCHTRPFQVHRLTQVEIFSFSNLLTIMPRPTSLKVTEYQWFRILAGDPHLILSRKGFGATPLRWYKHTLRAAGRGRISLRPLWNYASLTNFQHIQKYTALLPLNPDKRNDLLSMLPFLEPQYHQYYQNLP